MTTVIVTTMAAAAGPCRGRAGCIGQCARGAPGGRPWPEICLAKHHPPPRRERVGWGGGRKGARRARMRRRGAELACRCRLTDPSAGRPPGRRALIPVACSAQLVWKRRRARQWPIGFSAPALRTAASAAALTRSGRRGLRGAYRPWPRRICWQRAALSFPPPPLHYAGLAAAAGRTVAGASPMARRAHTEQYRPCMRLARFE